VQCGQVVPADFAAAVSLLMPWFFTQEGNEYRVKLLKAGGLFLVLAGIALAFGFFTGTLNTVSPN
jgi:hypothetical protein